MTIFDINLRALGGGPAQLDQHRGKAVLVVNVASKCGLTPQYAALQALQDSYGERGLLVLGVPSNQFAGQEPGTAAEIAEFCQVNYGVTFPLTEKIEVNGPDRHPLYAELVDAPDAGRLHRRRPVELREVPGRPGRHGRRPVRAADRPGLTRADRRDREDPAPLDRRPGRVISLRGESR